MAGQKKAVWYHSPFTPNLKIALPNGSWVKFANGNICIAAEDPLYDDKIQAIEDNPNFGKQSDGARIYKVDASISLKSASTGMGKKGAPQGRRWNPTGTQKMYPAGQGSWYVCDKCGRKVATPIALELHAKTEHGAEYWATVTKEKEPKKLKTYGTAPLKRRNLASDPGPLKEPDPEPEPEPEEDVIPEPPEMPDIPPLD